jgi:hypothetical protein
MNDRIPITAPTLDQIKARNRFLSDAVIDACKRAMRSKSKDLWVAWFKLAGEKIGLEEYLGLFVHDHARGYPVGPGSGCTRGPNGDIYQSDWPTAVSVVGQAALTECPDMQADEIPHWIQEGRDQSAGWAQGVRSILG